MNLTDHHFLNQLFEPLLLCLILAMIPVSILYLLFNDDPNPCRSWEASKIVVEFCAKQLSAEAGAIQRVQRLGKHGPDTRARR